MVTVAKSFDIPIKLMFPYFVDNERKFSMLGLGDIVIPGVFIALLLRYDYYRVKNNVNGKVNTTFFNVTLIAYGFGLLVTVLIMYYFKHAQVFIILFSLHYYI